MERIADLDELILRCRNDQAREYISEAVACYRVGAYRASIVTAWIAVVYDLLDKVRELSLGGEVKAGNFVKEFEGIQEAHRRGDPDALKRSLDFERSILERVREDFEMLTPFEHMDLVRLKDDRNRCAHPTVNQPDEAYRPTAELARLHLRNAITHVLQQPPTQGKAAIEVLKREVSSSYFPKAPEQAIVHFKSGPLAKARDNLVKDFVGWLVASYFKKPEEAPNRDALAAAMVAAWRMYPNVSAPVLKKRLNAEMAAVEDSRVGVGALFVAHVPGTWDMLDVSHQDKLRAGVEAGPERGLARVISSAEKVEGLRDAAQRRIENLNAKQLSAILAYTQSDSVIQRALRLLAGSRSFYETIDIVDSVVMRLVVSLEPRHVEELLRIASENNEVRGSFGLSRLLEGLRENKIVQSEWLDEKLSDYGLWYGEGDVDGEPSDKGDETDGNNGES